jgi:hypothetical protein
MKRKAMAVDWRRARSIGEAVVSRALYGVGETARIMGRSRRSIYRQLARDPGSLPPTVRTGWRIYFLDVLGWLRRTARGRR